MRTPFLPPPTSWICVKLPWSYTWENKNDTTVSWSWSWSVNSVWTMSLNVPGLVAMVAFYLLVLGIGIWASVKSRRARERTRENRTEHTLLGNRGISLAVGVFTMTATFVGGGFITGLTEAVYTPTMGLTWAVMPVTGALSFIIGGLFFAKKMRERKYVTMMDPFQMKYGNIISAVLSVALLISDIIWVTGTLIGLGSTMSVILDMSYSVCIWISASVAIIYTLLGGLYSVAYTDIIQLILIFCSLWLCVPFVLISPYVDDITKTAQTFVYQAPWTGSVNKQNVWIWLDNFLLLTLGNLGYQDFHQRTLSSSSSATARITCFIAAPMIFVLGIPSVLIGAAAASTNWNMTQYGSPSPYERSEAGQVLPIALQYLTPSSISIVGIGAIAAAVMSSTDSALLSAASIFASNIYKNILRTNASETELQWVIRVTVVLVGLAGTSLSFLNNSVMVFWILGSGITYTIMFPQLVCVLFCKVSNGYGSIMGLLTGVFLRILCGEPAFGLSPIIYFPGCPIEHSTHVQCAPIQTISMLCTFIATLTFSYTACLLFNKDVIPEEWDIFRVKTHKAPQNTELQSHGIPKISEEETKIL